MAKAFRKMRLQQKKAANICRFFMWAVLIVCGGFQLAAILGISINIARSKEPYFIWPMILAMALLITATLLFSLRKPFFQKHRLWWVIIAGVAAAIIFASSLDIWQRFDVSKVALTLDFSPNPRGITLFTLIWRHLSSMLVFPLMLAVHILDPATPPEEEKTKGDDPFSTLMLKIDKEAKTAAEEENQELSSLLDQAEETDATAKPEKQYGKKRRKKPSSDG